MKYNWKVNVISVVMLTCLVIGLAFVDVGTASAGASVGTTLKVKVVNQDNQYVHNANVTIVQHNLTFVTDNKGMSPKIEVPNTVNWYDGNITKWFCVNVTITKDGYVPTIVVGCVLYAESLRELTVKIYQVDGSDLPYVSYVESPPSDYVEGIF